MVKRDEQLQLKLVHEAFEFAKSKGWGHDGQCYETSAVMWDYINKHGGKAKMKRYEVNDDDNENGYDFGGHITVWTEVGEFDPTIGCWGDDHLIDDKVTQHWKPSDAKCGELYRVSPHAQWINTNELTYDDIRDDLPNWL